MLDRTKVAVAAPEQIVKMEVIRNGETIADLADCNWFVETEFVDDDPIPDGAFYFYLDVQALLGRKTPGGTEITTADALCAYLLEEQEIAVVPGEGFGAPGYIRISYAADLDVLMEATRRLKRGLDALK